MSGKYEDRFDDGRIYGPKGIVYTPEVIEILNAQVDQLINLRGSMLRLKDLATGVGEGRCAFISGEEFGEIIDEYLSITQSKTHGG